MNSERTNLDRMVGEAKPPEWLIDMHNHYAETGAFRTEDILRILGDPKMGVTMGASEDCIKASLNI